ncbi:MAG: hypothetical protein ABIP54_00780 [Candidatus Andersenbacteria bacterium]
MTIKIEEKKFMGITTKTAFSWGVVLVIAGFASSYGSLLTRTDVIEKTMMVQETIITKIDEENGGIESRVTKLEANITNILDGIKEIKDSVKDIQKNTTNITTNVK